MIRICFTGHRFNKLGGGDDWNSKINLEIRNNLDKVLQSIIDKNENEEFYFITGGALGFDQFATDSVIKLKNNNPDKVITLEIAIPFKTQCKLWNTKDINVYNEQLKLADKITYVDTLEKYKVKGHEEGEYYPSKLNKRNYYMVDNSDMVIAYFNNIKGGTYNCIRYANRKNKKVLNIYNIKNITNDNIY